MFNVEEQEEGSLRRDGLFRLLEVDNDIRLPINNHIRVLVTAADVLHS
jgi:heme/copper-type cytochrome/quinol oxidase subunit 2